MESMEWLRLVVSLVLVTAGAEALVRGATVLALRAGVSSMFVGLTVVGFGTSSPELGASLAATAKGATDVGVGNVVGSNIFNVAAILGVTALIRPVHVKLALIRRDVAVALVAACVPWAAIPFEGTIGRFGGVVLLACLVAFVVLAYRAARRAGRESEALVRHELETTLGGGLLTREPVRLALHGGLVVLGLILLAAGSRSFVDAALVLGRAHGVSELVLGLTVVAAGTSLPELFTSVVATLRGNTDLAVGNILGSNIFNIFGILGTCAVVAPQHVDDWVMRMDAPVMLAATLALLPLLWRDGRITRVEGALLLAGYGAYLAALLARGGA